MRQLRVQAVQPAAVVAAVSDKADPLRRSLRTGVVITTLIGVATAVVSYYHALFVVREAGTTGRLAYLVPLFADGLILLCSTALYAAAQAGCGGRGLRRQGWCSA